jgi:acetolactate synthase-1/2/3 large subunit
VNVAIINNGYLGMVRQWQQFFYGGRYVATPMLSPDFVKLAEAHGLKGIRVTQRDRGGATPCRGPGRGDFRARPRTRLTPAPCVVEFVVEQDRVASLFRRTPSTRWCRGRRPGTT